MKEKPITGPIIRLIFCFMKRLYFSNRKRANFSVIINSSFAKEVPFSGQSISHCLFNQGVDNSKTSAEVDAEMRMMAKR